MKLHTLLLMLAASVLTGCQTSSFMSSAATDGDGITCNEVYQAFNAFSQDRQSAQAWAQLSEVLSPAAAEYANMGVKTAADYYPQVKGATNLTLAVRGCQPIQ
ncbi:hypothetical protein [Marinobacter sp. CHS3-4]|uniref:hypothetical protein n=1 Tax=Marinobacter sp. CHS3-4 TaxID=3045174 RepID=UPI0024B6253D|nr:hypothetical protein [Marinobacter sp. CHS3-4]MDI9244264.1 hypothetical protein [Marinobacter sp. CHS3-4]